MSNPLPVYLIGWRNFNIVRDSLNSFIRTASEPIEITFVSPNDTLPNSGTTEIRKYVRRLIRLGLVKRMLEFKENGFGYCLMKSIEDFRPKTKLFCMSDCDLIIPENGDWIALSREYHKKGWVVTGFNLSMENYLPAGRGFSSEDCNFGIWGMVLNTEFFFTYHGTSRNSLDSGIMDLARGRGGAVKIRELELFHCAWSLSYPESKYFDPEYRDYKNGNSNFVFNPKPSNMEYVLVES
jgi:hypothetical protein